MATYAKYLKHPRRGVAHTLSKYFKATGLSHCLGQKMTHALRRSYSMLLEQWTTFANSLKVVVARLRCDFFHSRQRFCHQCGRISRRSRLHSIARLRVSNHQGLVAETIDDDTFN